MKKNNTPISLTTEAVKQLMPKRPGFWRRLERSIRKRRKWLQAIISLLFHKPTSAELASNSRPNKENWDESLVAHGPIITVIMAVYDTPVDLLSAAIISVRDQIYKKWELIIVDDKTENTEIAAIILKFASEDKRIKTYFRSENGNISKALNDGLKLATGEFIAVIDHDDTLDPTALYWVARVIIANPLADYVYSDEDKLSSDGNTCYGPFYKPDWSPEYMLAMMYTCHLGVYRTAILKEVGEYRCKFNGAQDYDMTLRFLSRTNNVVHIPRVLYHWRAWEKSTAKTHQAKPYAAIRAREALTEFLNSRNEKFSIRDSAYPGHFEVKFLPKGEPLVSIVIPTANKSIIVNGKSEKLVEAVINSIEKNTAYLNYEIVVVHNGDISPEQINDLSKNTKIKLVHYRSEGFNLSDKINLGCSKSAGEYLLLMNDDIRVISDDWIDQMVGMVQREGIGVVGPKLLFPDDTIQHAGVVLLGGLPGHAYYQWPKNADGYGLGAKVNRNYLAVTGACSITPKWLFDKVGGYSNKYPLNYNDIDYCLRLHRMGFRSVFLANVQLYHFEGVSREGARRVLDSEIRMFQEDWGDFYGIDPYYNPNLNQSEPYKF